MSVETVKEPRAGTPAASVRRAAKRARADDLESTSWLEFLGTLIERFADPREPMQICRSAVTPSERRAIKRWDLGVRPSIWSAERFLASLSSPHHVEEYF